MTRRLGIVTGLASEAACLDGIPASPILDCRVVGADGGRAHDAAIGMIAAGCVGLVSFGTAGSLDPTLPPGAVIIGEAVWAGADKRFEVDRDWRLRVADLLAAQPDVHIGIIAGSPTAVGSPSDKRRLRDQSGAAAVDMESQSVARAAEEKGIPFLAIRAVVDDAHAVVPPWVTGVIAPDGTIGAGPTFVGLLTHPGDLPALIRLGSGNRKAHAALRRVALSLGGDFGFGNRLLG